MSLNDSLGFAAKNMLQCQNRQQWHDKKKPWKRISSLGLFLLSVFVGTAVFGDTTSQPKFSFDSNRCSVWEGDVGDGFRKHATEVGLSVGGGIGVRSFGGEKHHDFVLGDVHVGTMLTGIVGKDHCWSGNFELLGQLFGGEQVKPNNAYVVGVAPLLRYNFATGTRLVPFIDGGAGLTLTDIRHPDLSTDFEFNLQVGGGVHWFFKPNVSAMLDGRLVHFSNAGIDSPNDGVNTLVLYLGVNWFF